MVGSGTFGRVLECWDRKNKIYVAIKVVRNVQKYRDAAMIEVCCWFSHTVPIRHRLSRYAQYDLQNPTVAAVLDICVHAATSLTAKCLELRRTHILFRQTFPLAIISR